ncbi:MAG: single-stranded-DNA-specific exonuclease RecJ [Luteibaculaceae bacterium]
MKELLKNPRSGLLWVLNAVDNKPLVDQIANLINVSPPIAHMLAYRGVDNFIKAKEFFTPSTTQLNNPFLMADMQKAVDRVMQAIENKEKIMIYGDYDVDGTTSVALVYSFLSHFTSNIMYYIPDRYAEGYGVSIKGIDTAKEQGVHLIVALDCGINAFTQIDYANSLGIDFIICDHHLPSETLPNAVAVLDAKRADCSYPFKELSGCGVGFKLCQALVEPLQTDSSILFRYIDLLAVSIAADIVPMVDENRALTFLGLQKLNDNPLPGIKEIMGLSMRNSRADINDLVFRIGPRINAAGRMSSAIKALEILLAKTAEEAKENAADLEGLNTDRRETDSSVTEEACSMVEGDSWYKNAVSTVVHGEHWHKGVIGITASRLVERYYKPTIVFSGAGNMITGSARSVEGFDVHGALSACQDLIEQFGGHAFAAGLKLKRENFEAFKVKFNAVVQRKILPDQLIPKLKIDAILEPAEVTENFMKVLKRMSPFGPGNLKPRFLAENVYLHPDSKTMGSDNQHLRLVFADERGNKLSGPWFNQAKFLDEVAPGEPIKVVFTLEENVFNGRVNIQAVPEDVFYSNG